MLTSIHRITTQGLQASRYQTLAAMQRQDREMERLPADP